MESYENISVTQNFWNNAFNGFQPYYIKDHDERFNFLDNALLQHNIVGKQILEVGCGNGEISVYLAKRGALVTAIDFTLNSIENLKSLAKYNNVTVNGIVLDAMQIDTLDNRFDFIVGRMVLHHIEPFGEFVFKMNKVLKVGAIGLFHENSSRNKVLIFFRNHLVGKFGVPRYGDGVELPFDKKEVNQLKSVFKIAKVSYPDMVFWQMLGTYIFRKSKNIQLICKDMDRAFSKMIPFFNRYSYHQVVYFQK